MAGTSYDANGNLLNDTFNTYTWDVEGHNVATGTVTMTYDALEREVERNNSGTINQFVYALGTKVAVMNAQSVARGFVPLPGGVKAVYNPSLTTYRVPDWQGSMRIGSNYNRAYSFSVAFAPFGEQYDRGGSWPVEFTFAGNDNETTTNTNPEYDALYRKVHTSQGRWVSPDPAGLAAVDPSNPQTWNRYAYVLNNPLSFIDSLGLETCPSGSYNWCVDVTAPPLGDIGATGGGLRHAPVLDTSGLDERWKWFKTFIREVVKPPNTGPGSCLGVFTDTVTAPLKQIQSAAKNITPALVSALQAAPAGASSFLQQVNTMIESGAADASEAAPVLAVVTTAGAAAATAAPIVSAASPYVITGGADLTLMYGLGAELKAGANGQCHW